MKLKQDILHRILNWIGVRQEKLVKVARDIEETLLWSRTARSWELVAAGLFATGVGFFQDVISLVLSFLVLPPVVDLILGPLDEMAVGATPILVVLELLRRWKGWDVITHLRKWVAAFPTWTLALITALLAAIIEGLDIAVYLSTITSTFVPPTWFVTLVTSVPWEMADQYLLGFATFVFGIELYERWNDVIPPSRRIEGPTSSTEDE